MSQSTGLGPASTRAHLSSSIAFISPVVKWGKIESFYDLFNVIEFYSAFS